MDGTFKFKKIFVILGVFILIIGIILVFLGQFIYKPQIVLLRGLKQWSENILNISGMPIKQFDTLSSDTDININSTMPLDLFMYKIKLGDVKIKSKTNIDVKENYLDSTINLELLGEKTKDITIISNKNEIFLSMQDIVDRIILLSSVTLSSDSKEENLDSAKIISFISDTISKIKFNNSITKVNVNNSEKYLVKDSLIISKENISEISNVLIESIKNNEYISSIIEKQLKTSDPNITIVKYLDDLKNEITRSKEDYNVKNEFNIFYDFFGNLAKIEFINITTEDGLGSGLKGINALSPVEVVTNYELTCYGGYNEFKWFNSYDKANRDSLLFNFYKKDNKVLFNFEIGDIKENNLIKLLGSVDSKEENNIITTKIIMESKGDEVSNGTTTVDIKSRNKYNGIINKISTKNSVEISKLSTEDNDKISKYFIDYVTAVTNKFSSVAVENIELPKL